MKRYISIITIFFFLSCVTNQNKKEVDELLGIKLDGIDRVFYKKLNFMPEHEYPYLILTKFDCDSLKAVEIIQKVKLQRYPGIKITVNMNGIDFSNESFWKLSSILNVSIEYPKWWHPSLADVYNNFGTFYDDRKTNNKTIISNDNWNGRIIAQYFKGTFYLLNECYPVYSP